MSLTAALNLRTPLVWVASEEPGRILDFVLLHEAKSNRRPVFRLDAVDGLLEYHYERGWLKVLVPDPVPQEMGGHPSGMTTIHGMPDALPYVFNNGGVFLVEHAHTIVENLFGFFTGVMHRYREALKLNDADKVPPQFLLVSHKNETPGELLRWTTKVSTELPTEPELRDLTELLYREREMPGENDLLRIIRAAKGMAEMEYISAALTSLRDNDAIDAEVINRAKLDMLKDSGILEVSTPDLTLSDLGGLDNLKELIQNIAWIWSEPQAAAEFGVKPKRRLLLVGVPGSGKSLAAKAIASALGLDLAKGGVSNALSKWVGESESNMRRMFQTLRAMMPITFWIDEFGRDMSGSGTSNDSGTTDRVHGEFLTGMQELPDQIFLVGAANRIDSLPPEMLRSGRFDEVMFVGFPTEAERRDIFNIHLGKRAENYDVEALAKATPLFTGAEIEALLAGTRFSVGAGKRRHFTTDDVLADVPNVRGRVWINHRPAIIDMYDRAQREWTWASSGQQEEADRILAAARPTAPNAPATAGMTVRKW